jgi:thiamine-monophosphate kinase
VRELELIDELEQALGAPGPHVLRAIGDDAAVVRARGYAVISVDTMVDGVHFRSSQLGGEEIGHRALAAALSDLGAMGAAPGEAYLALGLARGSSREQALALIDGARELAGRFDVTIAGGDVTVASALTVSFTVVGWIEDPGEVVGRDGATVGDVVLVTGELGAAGAGLALVEQRAHLTDQARAASLRERYAMPRPRIDEGRTLASAGARAMIDLSDGLASDAERIAQRSGVAIELALSALPVPDAAAEVAAQLGADPAAFAASAGEDYELCACVPVSALSGLEAAFASASLARLTPVGRVVEGPPGVTFVDAAGQPSGYEHSF